MDKRVKLVSALEPQRLTSGAIRSGIPIDTLGVHQLKFAFFVGVTMAAGALDITLDHSDTFVGGQTTIKAADLIVDEDIYNVDILNPAEGDTFVISTRHRMHKRFIKAVAASFLGIDIFITATAAFMGLSHTVDQLE